MHKAKQTALVLQGGGALGAYEVGVIKALCEQPECSPDIVTGVSIGALNAAVLAGGRGDPVAMLETMWHDLSTLDIPFVPNFVKESIGVFGKPAMYHINPAYMAAPFLATSMYNTSPLRRSINKWVDFDKLNRSETYVAVAAVNIASGELETFDNRQGLTVDHLLASTSMPPTFPITHIEDSAYWDGGLVYSAPLGRALNALQAAERLDNATETELVVVDLFRNHAAVPGNLLDVMRRSFEIVFSSRLKQDLKVFRKMNDYLALLEELGQALPETSPVRQHPGFKELARYRKIDHLTVIENNDGDDRGGPADFSRSAIAHRVHRGYYDTLAQYAKRS